ncbi:MAG: retron Ec67 family RNA-directed DNA polymerase/endonuclease [Pseudomonadota bacterium]
MSSLKELRKATSLTQIASLLGVKAGMLSFQLYKKPKEGLYKKFEIPKRHGGMREILAPEKDLKLLQHRLSDLLQDCLNEINVANGHPEDKTHQGVSHGFKRHHTIMTNGRAHVTRRHVFNVDLHDFFGSINFGRVRGFFIKNKNFKLHPAVATVIAQIACYDNKLPQGSPCSPVISNLIGHSLDILLAQLAAGTGATYTRYADDLTFSTNKRDFPSSIAIKTKEHDWEPGRSLTRIVTRSLFSFNHDKTRMQYLDSRQEVTGLTVNKKVNVPATYRYMVRAMAHSLFRTGGFEFIYKKKDEKGELVITRSGGERTQLLGMLSYIDHVDQFNRKLREENGLEPFETDGRILLFRRFLYFDTFYAPDVPVIVCEGKTDNIYLKCAIKSLSASYPKLVVYGKAPKLKVRFFKYSDRRTSEVTQLTGGVGGICHLLKNYYEDVRTTFRAPMPKQPVIVLIDNDKGANTVYGAIAGITKKKKPTGKAPFIHVTSNLYVVPTPERGKGQSCIEDFFDKATLTTTLNGKLFNGEKNADESIYYGKAAFALNVVAKDAGKIDFKEFHPILERIVSVIDDYEAKRVAAEKKVGP